MSAASDNVCLRCGAPYPDADLAEAGIPDWPWWMCSPCRAEATGTVCLELPRTASPSTLPITVARGLPLRVAIKKTLRTWQAGLHSAAGLVDDFIARLDPSDAEAVANAVMGEDPLGEAHLRKHDGDVRTLVLSGLPPATARRLAETTFVVGPEMEENAMRDLVGR